MTDLSYRIPARLRRPGVLGLAAAALVAVGGTVGAVAVAESRPAVSMAPAVPVAIRALASTRSDSGVVTIRGRVAEVYGNKFVLADPTGRALVDTGREGEERALVAVGAPVTVQGRFERGFIHAAFLVGADGAVTALGPLMGPPHHHAGPDGPRGHGPDRGPDGGPDHGPAAPPPPAPTPAGNAAG